MGVDKDWRNPMIIGMPQYGNDFTMRARGYREGPDTFITAELIDKGEHREL
jgi:hypothetical protein